jgi:hypothetical protein
MAGIVAIGRGSILQLLQNRAAGLETTQQKALLALFEDPQSLATLVAVLAEPAQPSLPTTVSVGVKLQHCIRSSTDEAKSSVASISGSNKYQTFDIQTGRMPSSQSQGPQAPT